MRRKLAILLALALATSLMTTLSFSAQAHEGRSPFHGDSEYVLVQDDLTWEEANAAARDMVSGNCTTAHLATITSAEEQEEVDDLMAGTDENAWLGGFQQGQSLDRAWLWVTFEPFLYTNWGEGEPNDTPVDTFIPGSEQHLEALPAQSGVRGPGLWNDAPDSEQFFIVESEHCS